MNREESLKRYELLIDFIKQHRGRKNAVPRAKICRFLKNGGYDTTPESIGNLVDRAAKKCGTLILFDPGKGYFFPENDEDVQFCISFIEKKMESEQRHIEFLRSFLSGGENADRFDHAGKSDVRCADCAHVELSGCGLAVCGIGKRGLVQPWTVCGYGEKKEEKT